MSLLFTLLGVPKIFKKDGFFILINGQIQARLHSPLVMSKSEKVDSDRFLKEKEFDLSGGIDLSKFMQENAADSEENEGIIEEEKEQIIDEAIGDISSPFVSSDSIDSEMKSDGSVTKKPEDDIVTQMAKDGEYRMHWALMVSMITVYSIIGLIIGTTLEPMIALIGLLSLAAFGFWLGGRWIPQKEMHILGVTWVIISMKLLYGVALDLHHWGWIADYSLNEDVILGVLLLFLVTVNVFIAHWHDSDAIAVQATLILMVVASGASTASDEIGIESGLLLALLLLTATLLLHGLAIMRKSGNLAAMGIVASNLWIGVHALSDNWNLFGLELIRFDGALLLFTLFTIVNIINAIIATRFYKEENWFSQAFNVVGVGKPGLWGVSIGIGMIGALMTIAAHRNETGYALAQISMLLAAFGGSYLIVRGVESSKLKFTMYMPGALLIISLFIVESLIPEGLISGLANYSLFAVGAISLVSITLLNHQTAVSDAVLWIGCIVIVILLTILIPADQNSDGGLKLLLSIILTFGGLGILAIWRESPSLAGISVLGPWVWCLLFATAADTRIINTELIPIILEPWYLSIFCLIAILIQYPVNTMLGESGINLGSRFKGLSEFSAITRDSGALRLWNLSLLLSLLGWMAITYAGGIPAEGLFLGIIGLFGVHLLAEVRSKHQDTPLFLLYACVLMCLVCQFRFGFDAFWTGVITVFGVILAFYSKNNIEKILMVLMGGSAASLTLTALFPTKAILEINIWWPDQINSIWIQLFCVCLILGLYLPRAGKYEKILQPAIANGLMLLSCIILSSKNDSWQLLISFVMLFISSILLVMQAEVRTGLKDIAKRDSLIENLRRKQLIKQHLESGGTMDELGTVLKSEDSKHIIQASERGTIEVIDPELIVLLEKRRKNKLNTNLSEKELLLQDVHYKPVVMLLFIGLIFSITGYFSFSPSLNGNGGVANAMLLIAAIFSVVLISASRWRTKELDLSMSDIIGIEMPIAVSMGGISFVYLLGRISSSAIMENQMSLLILVIVLLIFGIFGIWGKEDLGRRIPSAVEWIGYCLAGSSIVGLFIFAATPPPFAINPLKYDSLIYSGPLFFMEISLISLVLIWDRIDDMRLKKNMEDHRGSAGRILWVVLITLLSSGPATLLVCLLMVGKSLKWGLPSVISITNLMALTGLYIFVSWINEGLLVYVSIIGIIGATLSCLGLAYISISRKDLANWVSCWALDAHALALISIITLIPLLGSISTIILILTVLGLSLSIWSTGIMLDLRTYRVWGAANLFIAWAIAILSIGLILDPFYLLLLLGATAILLGVITWLAQANKHILSDNSSSHIS